MFIKLIIIIMDAGTLITAGVMAGLIAVPLLMFRRSRNKIKKSLLASIVSKAKSENSNISEYEMWGFTLLGIDANLRKLFVARMENDIITQQEVNLAEFRTSHLFKSGFDRRKMNEGGTNKSLGIRLISKVPTGISPFIEIYNDGKELQAEGGSEFIEKWVNKINKVLA